MLHTIFCESDGTTLSSRRVFGVVFAGLLIIGGLAGLIIGIAVNAGQWPIIGACVSLGLGVVVWLFTLGFLTAQNIAEIAEKLKKPS